MKAVVVERPGVYGVQDVDEPEPREGEVVVEVARCGLCGTDVHIARGEFPPSPYPLIPGHEFAGRVVAKGPGVTDVDIGMRVAVDPTLNCGHCRMCREGHANLCENWAAIGDTVSGALAERVAVPAKNCYELDPSVSWELGALVEPVACGVWGVKRLRPEPGARVLILGGGTMGLVLARLLQHGGASRIVVVEPNAARREVARSLGVTATLPPEDEDAIRGQAPEGYEIVADATGVPAVVRQGLTYIGKGGTFLVFGVAPADAEVPFRPFDVYNRDLTIIGSMAINQTFGAAARLVSTLGLEPIVAPARGLEAYSDAIATFGRGAQPKQQLAPNGSL